MSDAPRVLHVIDSLNLGGAQTVLLGLLKGMQPERYTVDVASLYGPGLFAEAFRAAGYNPLHLAKVKSSPLIPVMLGSLIRRRAYDIVHAHLIPSSFLCERFRGMLGIKRLVLHMHNVYCEHGSLTYQDWLEKGLYRNADCVISCSEAATEGMPPAPHVSIIPNGVDTERFTPVTAARRNVARRELNFKNNDFVIGTSGRLVASKKQDLLIHAFAVLHEEHPNLRLLIVGSGPMAEALYTLAEDLEVSERVTFTGFQTDIEEYLAAMDVFAFFSEREAMPLSLLEAMATGLPCLANAFDSVHEVLQDGKDGLIVEDESLEAARAALKRLVTNAALRKRLSANALKTVETHFTNRVMADHVMSVYDDLMNE